MGPVSSVLFGPNPTVFQIGAHMGHLTIALALRFPSMRIFALEPSPLNFRFLVYNLKLKKLTSRVRPLNLVLMNYVGRSKLRVSGPTNSATVFKTPGATGTLGCKCLLMKKHYTQKKNEVLTVFQLSSLWQVWQNKC